MIHVDLMAVEGRGPKAGKDARRVGRVTLEDGRAVPDAGARRSVAHLVVVKPGDPSTVLTLDDGLAYMSALQYTIRGPYKWATEPFGD